MDMTKFLPETCYSLGLMGGKYPELCGYLSTSEYGSNFLHFKDSNPNVEPREFEIAIAAIVYFYKADDKFAAEAGKPVEEEAPEEKEEAAEETQEDAGEDSGETGNTLEEEEETASAETEKPAKSKYRNRSVDEIDVSRKKKGWSLF